MVPRRPIQTGLSPVCDSISLAAGTGKSSNAGENPAVPSWKVRTIARPTRVLAAIPLNRRIPQFCISAVVFSHFCWIRRWMTMPAEDGNVIT